MIKEAYVSDEVAKLLKEKGFNESCECAYSEEGQYLLSCYKGIADRRIKNDETLNFSYSSTAPTHQMAMKWLRKVHNILLFILPAQENGKLVYLVEVWTWNEEEGIYESTYAPMPRKEPEQAVEAALKYCLENIV